MPATVRRLLRQPNLQLELAHRGDSADHAIGWVCSSDLADPTPFLTGGEMLLTTGTQFSDRAEPQTYDAYVARLAARRVVALGFGTGVIRSGIPSELLDACVAHGLPLVAVPRGTPFLAIIRWAADILAREARAHDEWAFAAQRTISLAALGAGGLADVLAALGEQLSCRVALFDLDSEVDATVTGDDFSDAELRALTGETRRLLRAGGRASGSFTVGALRASVQTLGQPGRLHGALALLGDIPQDAATRGVVTGAVALAEVALEQRSIRRGSLLALHTEALALMVEGHTASVVRALPTIPTGRIRVTLVHVDPEDGRLAATLERRSRHLEGGLFTAMHRGALAVLVGADEWPWLSAFLRDNEATAGVSDLGSVDELAAGLAQARRALGSARSAGAAITEFSHLRRTSVTGVLRGTEAPAIAAARLDTFLRADAGRALLRCAAVWLSHNGQWDPAATALGLHRHSLRSRIERVGEALELDLATFTDRAELWLMLTVLDLDLDLDQPE
ncbi:MAG: PucR family transcriptional regulator [Cryobacterium sp.]